MTPPYPPRPPQSLSPLKWMVTARDNLLATWPQTAYAAGLMEQRFLGRRILVANSAESVGHVLVRNAGSYRKSRDTHRALSPLIGDGLFISEGERWLRQRRLIAPLLHNRYLPEFVDDMIESGQEMLERWHTMSNGAELEITQEMAQITTEVICRSLMSAALGKHNATTVFDAFSQYQDSLGRLDVLGFFGLPDWIPRPGVCQARSAVTKMDGVVKTLITEHRKPDPKQREDLLDRLLHGHDRDNGETLSAKQIQDEVKVFFLAGHETTANTLTWAIYLVSQFPEVESRLFKEIDQMLDGRIPRFDDLPKLTYTRAIVEETLRLYPPLYVLPRETTACDHLGKHQIPTGTLVVIAPWLLHRHRRYWRNPDAFQPERFLPEHAQHRPKHCYVPFGAGPRVCPGAQFGSTEAILVLAMIAQHFRLRLRQNHPVEPLGRLTLRPRYGLPMCLEKRKR